LDWHGFLPITKVDAVNREVYGVLAEEAVDKSKEIFDYTASKPLFQKWNETFSAATSHLDQPSVGNVREMHGKSAAGKFIRMEYDDSAKKIMAVAKVVDDAAWNKVSSGVYTGFSIGGDYVKRYDDPTLKGVKRYVANPVEGSLVDNPCMYGATFQMIKSTDQIEIVKFIGSGDPTLYFAKGKTKKVDGEDLGPSAFLYVGSPDDTSTWHLPVHFSSPEKSKNHIHAAFGRFGQADIPGDHKHTVAQSLISAAHSHGIDPTGFAAGHIKASYPNALKKGLYDVGILASMLESLSYLTHGLRSEREWEGDDSPIPDDLKAALTNLKQIFVRLAEEEASELVAQHKTASVDPQIKKREVTPTMEKVTITSVDELVKGVGAEASPELLKAWCEASTTFFKSYLEKAKNHMANLEKGIENLRGAHEKMGEHIDACESHMGKAADKMHEHVTGIRKEHTAMESHLDKVEGSMEGIQSMADAENDRLDRGQKSVEARFGRMLKAAGKESSARISQLENLLIKVVERAAGGGGAAVVQVPARTFVAPDRQNDGVQPAGGVVTPPAVNKNAIQVGDQAIIPVLPNGMPNPNYVEAANKVGNEAFAKAVKGVKIQQGNPFPPNDPS
jgi:hypothetical protein